MQPRTPPTKQLVRDWRNASTHPALRITCAFVLLPMLLMVLLLAGDLADGCKAGDRYISSTMNNDLCLLRTHGRRERWSARIMRWVIWHAVFGLQVALRLSVFRASRLRNSLIAAITFGGLGAVWSGSIELHPGGLGPHFGFGALFFFSTGIELTTLWIPCCNRRGDRLEYFWRHLTVNCCYWTLGVAFAIYQVSPSLNEYAVESEEGDALYRPSMVLQWALVCATEVVYAWRVSSLVGSQLLLRSAASGSQMRLAVDCVDDEHGPASTREQVSVELP